MQVTLKVNTEPPASDLQQKESAQPTHFPSDKAAPAHSTTDPNPQADDVIKAVHASSESKTCSNAAHAHAAAPSSPIAESGQQTVCPVTPSGAAVQSKAACNSNSLHTSCSGMDIEDGKTAETDTTGSACNSRSQDSAIAALQQQLAEVTKEAKELKKRATMPPLTPFTHQTP